MSETDVAVLTVILRRVESDISEIKEKFTSLPCTETLQRITALEQSGKDNIRRGSVNGNSQSKSLVINK